MRETRPTQIIGLTRKIDAVYVWSEDGNPVIGRTPVIALALCDEVKVSEFEDEEDQIVERGIIKYIDFSPENYFDLDEPENLLGYEIDGDQQGWGKEIEGYVKREKASTESWELHTKRVLLIKDKFGDQIAKDFAWKWGKGSIPTNKKATEAFEKLMGQSVGSVGGA